jgi:hypothetical protein
MTHKTIVQFYNLIPMRIYTLIYVYGVYPNPFQYCIVSRLL